MKCPGKKKNKTEVLPACLHDILMKISSIRDRNHSGDPVISLKTTLHFHFKHSLFSIFKKILQCTS